MASPLQPEFFLLVGVNLFLAISLLTCLLDRHLPWQLSYLYQLAALTGFGQLLVSREFLLIFGEYMRFWYAILYLIVALANIVAVNAYLGVIKKLLTHAKIFMFGVTFPAMSMTAFFVASYAELASHPLIIVPQISWEATFMGIVSFDIVVVGLGTYVFFKPKWWYVAGGAVTAIVGAGTYAMFKPTWGDAPFVVSAVGLAVACIIVLGISVYVLAKIWIETMKERKRKKGGETKK